MSSTIQGSYATTPPTYHGDFVSAMPCGRGLVPRFFPWHGRETLRGVRWSSSKCCYDDASGSGWMRVMRGRFPSPVDFHGKRIDRHPCCFALVKCNNPPIPNTRPLFSRYHIDPLLNKEVFKLKNQVFKKNDREKAGIWSRGKEKGSHSEKGSALLGYLDPKKLPIKNGTHQP